MKDSFSLAHSIKSITMLLSLSKYFLLENLSSKIILVLKVRKNKTQLMKTNPMFQIIVKVFFFNQALNILKKKKIQKYMTLLRKKKINHQSRN
jgi:hypothetical protein